MNEVYEVVVEVTVTIAITVVVTVVVIDHCQNVEVVVVRIVELTRAVEVCVEVTLIWLLFVIVKVFVVNTVEVPTARDCAVTVEVTNTVLVSAPGVLLLLEGPGIK